MKNDIYTVDGFYKLIPLKIFRETAGVRFETIPDSLMPSVSSLDIVRHEIRALSPGSIGSVGRPWYMHPYQRDNLIVLEGERTVELYKKDFGLSVKVKMTNSLTRVNGNTVLEQPAMLVWEPGVFHRVISGPEGSLSINMAEHNRGFDLKTNFNIYDLDGETGRFVLLRKGELDQN